MMESRASNSGSPQPEAPVVERPGSAAGPGPAPGREPLGLSLGVHIGTLVGLILFAGMYSLFVHELRIAATVFLAGLTLGLAGGMVATLMSDAYWTRRQNAHESDEASWPRFWESIWDGLVVGLGILLGTLPISLTCSLFRQTSLFPEIIYVLGGTLLLAVGVVRAPTLRSVPNSVAHALLPGLAGVLLAHFLGDLLGGQMALP